MKKIILHEEHESLGARFIDFNDWQMPVFFKGIIEEHMAVRENTGIFDISHMGQILISGKNAMTFLNQNLTNNLAKLEAGKGQYTFLCNDVGGVVDDLLAYQMTEETFFLVVNAGKSEQVCAIFRERLKAFGDDFLTIKDLSEDFGGLAIQGKTSAEIFAKMQNMTKKNYNTENLPERNRVAFDSLPNLEFVLCRTGYTGEDGFEVFVKNPKLKEIFATAISAGAVPCGLGARDTLRLEMCYPLNGSDLSPDLTPVEAGLGYFVSTKKTENYPGKKILTKQKSEGVSQKLVAIALTEKSPPPRHGYEVYTFDKSKKIGEITSGAISPMLKCGIAMAYLPIEFADKGTEIQVKIRQRFFAGKVCQKPFLKKV